MSVSIKETIFREYDIRGVADHELTDDVVELLGRAYISYIEERRGEKPERVVVGRDVRLSSERLWKALTGGIASCGVNIIDIGICPTPLEYFALHRLKPDGGIMITGSHNPPEYNGFKISVGRETIHGPEIQRIKQLMYNIEREGTKPSENRGTIEKFDIIQNYIDYHVRTFSATIPSDRLPRKVKIVVDSGNGTAGLVAPELLRRLGCEVIELYCTPDGNFPNHHPDPTIEANLKDLIEKVCSSRADFGVAYDGDADRIGVVDETGRIVWGDELMIIFSREILERKPGSVIVGEVKCSQIMYDEIERLGGKPVMWKTGHSLIKAKMKELGAELAGEMSGHIFFRDRYLGFDDAIYASVRLVEIFARRLSKEPEFRFSSLLSGLPETFSTPEIRVDCTEEEKFQIIDRLKEEIKREEVKKIIDIDGLRMVFDDGWALVRASNTQPVIVVRFEALSEESLKKIQQFVAEKLRTVWKEARLPF